jgi:hypothetical protein
LVPRLDGGLASDGPEIVLRIEPAPSTEPPFFLRVTMLHLERKKGPRPLV